MRRKVEPWLAGIAALLVCACLSALPPKSGAPLTEQDVARLLARGASNKAITDLVQRYGVTFELDEGAAARLRKRGAQENLLKAVRRAAPAPKPVLKPPPKEVASPPPPPPDPVMLEASRHLKLGEAKVQDRDFDGALREFAEAERMRPAWAEVSFRRSLLLAALERYSEAATEGKKYVAVAGSSAEIETFSRRIAEWQARAEKNEEANRLIERGDRELSNFQLDAAIKSLQEAVNLNPSLNNLLRLAGAYALKGDDQSLSSTAEAVLAHDPHSAYAVLYKAAAALGEGDVNGARAVVQQGLSFNPHLAFGYGLLGAVLQERDRKKGQQEKMHPVRIDSNSGRGHNRLGWVLWNGGQYREAIRELRKAAEIEPANAAWCRDLSYALHFRGDEAGALAAARRAIQLDQNSASAHDAMGLALENMGSLDQADREYEEAVRLGSPDSPEFARHLNEIKQKRVGGHVGQRPAAELR